MRKPVLFLFASCLAAAVRTDAAPLKRADVPANPAWVLHLDCDALRQTYAGKYLLYQMDKPEMNSNMLAFQSIFSFDLRTQLHGVTVYGDGPTPKDSVVIIYADYEPDHVATVVGKEEGLETFTNHQHVIYSWLDKKNDSQEPAKHRDYGVFQGGRMIVAKHRESIDTALAVIDGSEPNFSTGKDWPDAAAASGTTFLQGAARKLDFLEPNANTALLRLSRRARFQACETDEHLHAVLTLEVDDEGTARQLSMVAQGVVAMLGLQKENANLAKLAGGLAVQQNGTALTATLSTSSADLISVIKTAFDKKSNHKTAGE